MRPEDALAQARLTAAEHAATTIPKGGLEVERSSEPTDDQLASWAVVEPDLREVRSTRGGPVGRTVTALKQGQLRLMAQYHAQVMSVQNRLNVHLALRATLMREDITEMRAELQYLRGRVEELESQAGIVPPPDPNAKKDDAAYVGPANTGWVGSGTVQHQPDEDAR